MQESAITMTFIMPSEYTAETLPQPVDEWIKIENVGEYTVAVIKFTWSLTEARADKFERKLRDLCERDKVRLASTRVVAGYNPPWAIPFLRTNEVQIPVVEESSCDYLDKGSFNFCTCDTSPNFRAFKVQLKYASDRTSPYKPSCSLMSATPRSSSIRAPNSASRGSILKWHPRFRQLRYRE